jgi:hypothetical protein
MLALLLLPALILPAAPRQAAAQEPVAAADASLDRIRGELTATASSRIKNVPVQFPVTFKSKVDQRVFVPTLEEHLHKEFDLTPMQRQSADWSARCCGFNLGALVKHVEDGWRARKIRKTREQIARELAELDAARARDRDAR